MAFIAPFLSILGYDIFNPQIVVPEFVANRKKYTTGIKSIIKDEMQNPSDEFVKFFISQMTKKRATQNLIEEFKEYVRSSLSETINDIVNEKIDSIKDSIKDEPQVQNKDDSIDETKDENNISDEEQDGFHIIKAILFEVVAGERISYRNTTNYLSVVCDDSRRKWICFLYLKTSKKYILFNDESSEKVPFETLQDLYSFRDRFLNISRKILNIKSSQTSDSDIN